MINYDLSSSLKKEKITTAKLVKDLRTLTDDFGKLESKMKSLNEVNKFKYSNVHEMKNRGSNAASKINFVGSVEPDSTSANPKRKQSSSNSVNNNDAVDTTASCLVEESVKSYASVSLSVEQSNDWIQAGKVKAKVNRNSVSSSNNAIRKKSVKGIVGSGSVSQKLSRVPKRFHFKIGRCQAHVDEEAIKSHVEGFVKSGVIDVSLIPMKHYKYYKLFKVSIDDNYSGEMWKESNWPEGIEVSRFFIRSNQLSKATDTVENKKDDEEGSTDLKNTFTTEACDHLNKPPVTDGSVNENMDMGVESSNVNQSPDTV